MPGDKLKIYNNIENFNAKNPIVSVGIFDGVHIGHKKIIDRLNELAVRYKGESVLVTLWPHPKEVLKSENNNSLLLTTREEKESLLEKSGIDNLITIPFTKEFSQNIENGEQGEVIIFQDDTNPQISSILTVCLVKS